MAFDIYIRISKEGARTEEEVAKAVALYEEACRTYAKTHKLTVGEVEHETNVSGYSTKVADRKLDGLILRVEAGESEGVITPNLERFARDVIEGATAEKRIIEAGGTLRTVEDGYTSGAPGSALVFNLRMAVAQDYAARAGEGLRSRKRRFIEDGGWSYKMPFGYKTSAKGKRPEKVTKDAAVVVKLFARRAGGEAVTALANEYGLPLTQARSILSSRFYLGEVRLEVKKGVYETLKNHHAPILTESQWQAAQIKGEYHARDGSIAAGCKLAGIVYCGGCGARCRAAKTGRGGKVGYVCTEKECNARGGASAHLLDPHVRAIIDHAILWQHPAVGAILEGSSAYADALADVEKAQASHDEYRDDVDAQEALGMKSWLEGLKVRAERVVVAREALTEARKTARPDWWQGKTAKKVTLAEFDAEDDRRLAERFVDKVVVSAAGRGTGKLLKLHERVTVTFIGDDESYVLPVAVAVAVG